MKKNIILIFTIFIIIMFPSIVNAACSTEIQEKFNEHKNEFEVSYEMDPETKKYTVYFYNPLPTEFTFISHFGKDIKWEIFEDNLIINYDVPASHTTAYVVGQTDDCKNKIFRTIDIDLPEYNKLSENELCQGIEEFVLCQPDYDKEISYEDFVSRVETYKQTKAKEATKKEEEPKSNVIKDVTNNIVDYLKDNLVQVIIIGIFIIVLTISLILGIKSFRKSRRLE